VLVDEPGGGLDHADSNIDAFAKTKNSHKDDDA
jgi:hypothetical protein